MSSLKKRHIFVTAERSKASARLVKNLAQLHSVVEASKPLPPTHDILKKFFKNEKEYYKDIFDKELSKSIDENNNYVFYTQSKPDKILEFFPNSIIINYTQDPKQVAKDIVDDSVNSLYNLEYDYLIPQDNDYLRFINILKEKREDLTKADIWAFEHKKKFWQDKYYDQYFKNIENKVVSNMFYRSNIDTDAIINVNNKSNINNMKNKLEDLLN
tara:strand:+ start:1477 stop:2118 length:642 start_codon:yes stop_codon:yes gene_type:complete